MKIFHHIDADGYCAAYCAYKLSGEQKDAEFFPINYGVEFPFESIQAGEEVIIVDYSIEPEEMDKLLDITTKVTWIDHHKTAIAKYDGYDKTISGIRYNGIAGCMLTYCYFSFISMLPELQGDLSEQYEMWSVFISTAPKFIKLVADYDVWTFEYGDTTRQFHEALELMCMHPVHGIWTALDSFDEKMNQDMLNKMLVKGIDCIKYRENFAKKYCESKGFECNFDGYKAYCLNMAMVSSNDFNSVEGEYDLYIGFSFNGESWTYSIRSNKDSVDCSEIASNYGGGGHKGAAGFRSKELLLGA